MKDRNSRSVEPTDALWFKSTYSGGEGNECVEIALAGQVTGVRDSKAAGGPELAVAPAAFAAFLDGLKSGRLDTPR
ncbi:DUF397 domain-containing protein [Streptomyces candidus]|uniref:DUF397 domain-containing protein n=1 Tax=Streptomyces candidus TaxID=67283 RepID=A0A7X0HJZ2_9ACTN|nr:DUF397 domain-containing protein [Streptomyces candidus]MBB6437558.1 hypothetical protein [Streptomyces candidus]GHH53833.1 hypothetical protein GCM10018773_55940 [Streptomyces candidus]